MFSYDNTDEIKPGDIPIDTIELYVGMYYNKPIKKSVLPKLRILHLGRFFNNEFEEGCLPESLEILIFGMNYNVKFKKNVLPHNLKNLSLGTHYCQDIDDGVLPESLEIISFGRLFNFEKNRYYIPLNVKVIKCNGKKNNSYLLNNLPLDIEKLYLDKVGFALGNLPIMLKELYIDNFCEEDVVLISKIPLGCEVYIVVDGIYTNINDAIYKYQ